MRNLFPLLIMIMAILFSGCGEDQKCYLIYADVTGSMSDDDSVKVLDDVKSILRKLEPPFEVQVRLVDFNGVEDAFFDFRGDLKSFNRNERKNLRAILKKRWDSCLQVLNADEKVYRSCIIDVLDPAHDFFKSKEDYDEKYLIFCSDMWEDCREPNGSAGMINLCPVDTLPGSSIKGDGVFKALEEEFQPKYNLKELGVDIRVVLSSSVWDSNRRNCLGYSEFKEFWQRVFMKVGYSREDLDDWNFTQVVPAKDKFTRPFCE